MFSRPLLPALLTTACLLPASLSADAPATTIAVAAGSAHSLFLKSDGTAWVTGSGVSGSINGGTPVVSTPAEIMTGVSAISACQRSSLFLRQDGSVWGGGTASTVLIENRYIGLPMPDPRLLLGSDAKAVACGGDTFIIVLKKDGTAWTAGNNNDGALGDGTLTRRYALAQVINGVQAIAAGDTFSLFLKTDGTVWLCGTSVFSSTGPITSPVQVMSGVRSIAAAGLHCFFVKSDDTLWAAGYNLGGLMGDGDFNNVIAPAKQIMSGIASVATGVEDTLFFKTDGTVWGAGSNSYGQLGTGSYNFRVTTPVQLSSNIRSAAISDKHTLMIMADGSVKAAGDNGEGQAGDGFYHLITTPAHLLDGVTKVSAGPYDSLFLKTNGEVWATGQGSIETGDLGGQYSFYDGSPAPAPIFSDAIDIFAGWEFTMILKSDGTVWGAGVNGIDGFTRLPLDNVTAFSGFRAFDTHFLYLTADGTAWAQGNNGSGELGQPGIDGSETPLPVMTGVKSLAAGERFSLFLKTDGTVWGAGENSSGQLGDGTSVNRSSPVQAMAKATATAPAHPLTDITAIAVGDSFSFFLKSDGTLWAAGFDGMADGSSGAALDDFDGARQIASGVATMAASEHGVTYAKSDGSVWMNSTRNAPPLQSVPISGVKSIAMGAATLYLKDDGSVWETGDTNTGALGLGAGAGNLSPVPIMQLEVAATSTPTWEEVNFGNSAADPAIAGPTADPDGDGIPNLLEMAFHLSPLHADARILDSSFTGGLPAVARLLQPYDPVLQVHYLRRRASFSANEPAYTPEFTSNPYDAASWLPLVNNGGSETVQPVDGEWELVTIVEPASYGLGKRFARVRVTKE